ncbi:MAG: Cna B-type domain-containing protein [Ruminococcaceae bacterium]|nr:Cna B-type domain-containing protein [Oscillospiraceae bacterium]
MVKSWEDNGNQKGNRPESIQVQPVSTSTQ